VGRLDRWKGQEVFLRAMALVKDAVPNVRGIVIGDPVPYDPDYGNLLPALCDELGLSKHVIFSEFRQDMPTVMSALDVLVLASISPEPFGRVLIEAMAAGRPVVATDAGAVREIVEDGVHGLLVPPGDVQALAGAIVHILTHRDLAVAMGQEGQARVRERFDVQRYVDGVQAVYRDLLP
jgi:glycosyltransferase involved in cell wall biosynthesis